MPYTLCWNGAGTWSALDISCDDDDDGDDVCRAISVLNIAFS